MSSLFHSSFLAAVWSQLWQVTALIAVVAIIARLVLRNRPHLAHVLWLIVLVKCITPPWLASPGGLFSRAEAWLSQPPSVESNATAMVMPISGREVDGMFPLPPSQSCERLACVESTTNYSTCDWTAWAITGLAAAWTFGTVFVVVRSFNRWRCFLRLIRRPACREPGPYDAMVDRLSRQLGVRRPVRLCITASRVGPAVVGWIRPVIILPEVLVHGRPASELEPILAHELVHLRRGDTWTGLLRMAVQTVWWFHPMVRWVSRAISREAETCCDEAVVAELGIRPAEYARCLLGVLKRKHLFSEPIPAFPGVRPVEVTSKRMERIMRLGQGSRQRSPWWCYVVMIIAAAAVLPGAAWVAAEEEKPGSEPGVEISKQEPGQDSTATPPSISHKPVVPSPESMNEKKTSSTVKRIVVTYDVRNTLEMIEMQLGVDRLQAKKMLLQMIKDEFREEGQSLDAEHLKWLGDKPMLLAFQARDAHKLMVEFFNRIRRRGCQQVLLKVQCVSVSAQEVDSELRPGDYKLLEKEEVNALSERISKNADSRVLAEPHLVGIIGRPCSFRVGEFVPTWIGFKNGKPDTIQRFHGIELNIVSVLLQDQRMRLKLCFGISELNKMEHMTVENPVSGELFDVPIPRIDERLIETGIEMRPGQTAVFVAPSLEGESDGSKQTLIAIQPELVAPIKPVKR